MSLVVEEKNEKKRDRKRNKKRTKVWAIGKVVAEAVPPGPDVFVSANEAAVAMPVKLLHDRAQLVRRLTPTTQSKP